jgi:hypothetical protein
MGVLDGLRKKRNQADYTGAPITEREAAEAITQANALLGALRDHLRTRHPHLIEQDRYTRAHPLPRA